MSIEKQYKKDVEEILSHQHDNGSDLWATPDKRLIKGSPFSTLECVMYLLELGMAPSEPILKEASELIFSRWTEDGVAINSAMVGGRIQSFQTLFRRLLH